MKKLSLFLVLAVLVLGGMYLHSYSAPQGSTAVVQAIGSDTRPEIKAYFSPKGGCTEAIVDEIKSAQATILVQAYSFTSKPITQALINAYKRGVKVEIILDKSQRTERDSQMNVIVQSGIPCLIDAQHSIAHNKIMILDKTTLITGSFNLTASAESRNAENLLIIKNDPELVSEYLTNYAEHKHHSN